MYMQLFKGKKKNLAVKKGMQRRKHIIFDFSLFGIPTQFFKTDQNNLKVSWRPEDFNIDHNFLNIGVRLTNLKYILYQKKNIYIHSDVWACECVFHAFQMRNNIP